MVSFDPEICFIERNTYRNKYILYTAALDTSNCTIDAFKSKKQFCLCSRQDKKKCFHSYFSVYEKDVLFVIENLHTSVPSELRKSARCLGNNYALFLFSTEAGVKVTRDIHKMGDHGHSSSFVWHDLRYPSETDKSCGQIPSGTAGGIAVRALLTLGRSLSWERVSSASHYLDIIICNGSRNQVLCTWRTEDLPINTKES